MVDRCFPLTVERVTATCDDVLVSSTPVLPREKPDEPHSIDGVVSWERCLQNPPLWLSPPWLFHFATALLVDCCLDDCVMETWACRGVCGGGRKTLNAPTLSGESQAAIYAHVSLWYPKGI